MRAWLVKAFTADTVHVPRAAALMRRRGGCSTPAPQTLAPPPLPALGLSRADCGMRTRALEGTGKRPSHFHPSSKPNPNTTSREIRLHSCWAQPVSSTHLFEYSTALNDKTRLSHSQPVQRCLSLLLF